MEISKVIILTMFLFLYSSDNCSVFAGVLHHQDSDLKDLEKQIMQSKRSKLLRESKENLPKVIRTPPGTNGRHRTRPGRSAELLEEIYI